MKSTYKLIGAFWDQRIIPKEKPIFTTEERVLDLNDTITLSYIFSQSDKKMTQFRVDNKEQVLEIDYIPSHNSRIEKEFYAKRLLQVIEYLSNKYTLKIYVDKNNEKIINDLLECFFKKEKRY